MTDIRQQIIDVLESRENEMADADAGALMPLIEGYVDDVGRRRAAEEVRTVRQWLLETGRADADTLLQLRERVDQIAAARPA